MDSRRNELCKSQLIKPGRMKALLEQSRASSKGSERSIPKNLAISLKFGRKATFKNFEPKDEPFAISKRSELKIE